MNRRRRQNGFSIAEILIAVGILTVAMLFIAGVFPVGIRFMQVSADRTTAAFVANEAFAKIQLYANQITPNFNLLRGDRARDFNDWFDEVDTPDRYVIDANTFSYPTDNSFSFDDKHYCWSAILRQTDNGSRDVQVTVFISRKSGPSTKYYLPDYGSFGSNDYARVNSSSGTDVMPHPVRVDVKDYSPRLNELIIPEPNEQTLINDGDLIVDEPTGKTYRVLERYAKYPDTVLLDKDFDWPSGSRTDRFVWVVPPPAAPAGDGKVSGKSPCVGVYQKVIRF